MARRYAVVIVTYNRLTLLKECIQCVETQTIPATRIIVVNNASTDKTTDFLSEKRKQNDKFYIIECKQNIGGAGGFYKGVKKASEEDIDMMLLIDDDAMIADNYMEQIFEAKESNTSYHAFAGVVLVDGKIDIFHRKNIRKYGLKTVNCTQECYQNKSFECDVVSFCGMVVEISVVNKIGFPLKEYFIWHDDTEYSLRINKYTKFLVVPQAVLVHKTKNYQGSYPRRYDWREYYGIRNRLLYVKKHGTPVDWLLTRIDIFWNAEFRNWLFGVIKKNGYDWAYEKKLVRAALKDAKEDQTRNVIINK